jgi:ribonuclease Z
MAKLIFLGTASAVSYQEHENTYLVLKGPKESILIDCAANPLLRLKKAGIHFEEVSDLIITHFHADHVSGLPNLLMDMWILGRKSEFRIHGSEHTITRVQKMMALFDWDTWSGLYPVSFHTVPLEETALVLESSDFIIHSSPVDHLIPTIGLRIEYLENGFSIAYSSDTNPVDTTIRLAKDTDVLIHEAAGSYPGHSAPSEAGEIASKANAGRLYLIHYSLQGNITAQSMLADAKKTFPGEVTLAEDFAEIDFIKE